MAASDRPQSVLITGASSGIGEALAKAYAGPGTHLALTGRNAERLEETAQACRARGAEVTARGVDSTDAQAMEAFIAEIDAAQPLDLAIANAGISAGTGSGTESAEQARAIFKTNVEGVLNTLLPATERMAERGRGQAAIISSLAAFRGFPGAPAYCGSKAAVRVWGEALRVELQQKGVGLTVICPGYVKSRMTAVNSFHMPFLMETDEAAAKIKRAIDKNKARLAFPFPLAAAVWLFQAIPPAWIDPLLKKLPKKV